MRGRLATGSYKLEPPGKKRAPKFLLAAALLVLSTIILAVSVSTTVDWCWYQSRHASTFDLLASTIGFLALVGFLVSTTKKWWRWVVPFSVVFLTFQLFSWTINFTRVLDSYSVSTDMSYTLSWTGFGATGDDFVVIYEVNRRYWPFAIMTKVHSYIGATSGNIVRVDGCDMTLSIRRYQSSSETVTLAIPGCETKPK